MADNASKINEIKAQLAQVELEYFLMREKAAACDRLTDPGPDGEAVSQSAYATLQGEKIGYMARALYLKAFIEQYTATLANLK